jgi:dipeptidyl aminopeptidase/acylaminoacyl peptidase
MRRFAAFAVGCALALPMPALAAPFTVDRLLALEQLGAAKLDPTGRWLVVQRYDRWDSAPTWDLERQTNLSLGRIQVFDTAAGGAERELQLPQGAGYTALGVSPGGKRLAVGRLVGHAYDLGVVELQTGQVRWLGITPRIPAFGPDILWRSDDEILVAAVPSDWPDLQIGFIFQPHERLTKMWADQARGETSVTVIGSGRYRDLRPKAAELGLVSINVRTGAQRTLLAGAIDDFEIAPGGHAAAVLVEGEDIQPLNEGPKTTASPPRFQRLNLLNLDTGEAVVPCANCEVMDRMLAWSPDGKEVLIFARQGDIPFSQGKFWRLGLNGQAKAIDLGDLKPDFGETYDTLGFARGEWLGGDPVVAARPKTGGRADYWRITKAGPRNLTSALPGEPSALGVSAKTWAVAAGDQVWRVTATESRPWGVSPSKVLSTAAAPPGMRGSQTFVPRLEQLALAADATPILPWNGVRTPVAPTQTRVIDATPAGAVELARDDHGVQTLSWLPKAGPAKVVATVNSALADVEFPKPIEIHHKGPDGKALISWLYLPAQPNPLGGKPPVVVLPYPASPINPSNALAPGRLYLSVNPWILAGQGYAALAPAMPYLEGREPTDGMAEQILGPVDAAAQMGLIDAERVAVWGHSYGGYTAVVAATQSKRFRAVIATAPSVDLINAYSFLAPLSYIVPETGLAIMASTGSYETGQFRMGVPPWVDPQRYVRNSPILQADKITAPMLLIYGDGDRAIEQPQTLFGALYRQNKDAIFLTYRGEAHVINSPANVRDQYQRIFAFLDETLARRSPAAPSPTPAPAAPKPAPGPRAGGPH